MAELVDARDLKSGAVRRGGSTPPPAPTVEWHVGHALTELPKLAPGSVQTIITSPPYWGLRNYGIAPSVWSDGEHVLGSEDTLERYLKHVVAIFEAARPALKDDGSFWLNVGDIFATNRNCGLPNKSQVGLPWRVAFALQEAGWILRQNIVWYKTNVIPESIKDRCTYAHEFVFHFVKTDTYYFNVDDIVEKAVNSIPRRVVGGTKDVSSEARVALISRPRVGLSRTREYGGPTRRRRSVWAFGHPAYKGAHYATMPVEMAEICIKATSRPGDLILDPFAGTGVVGNVAERGGRKAVLIDVDERSLTLYNDRWNQNARDPR